MPQDVTYSKESEVNFLTENTFQENQEKKKQSQRVQLQYPLVAQSLRPDAARPESLESLQAHLHQDSSWDTQETLPSLQVGSHWEPGWGNNGPSLGQVPPIRTALPCSSGPQESSQYYAERGRAPFL